jgi:hypothetical protein
MGGAIPPPQSMKEHISPVPGTYQSALAPPYAIRSLLVQPEKSVFAVASAVKARDDGEQHFHCKSMFAEN